MAFEENFNRLADSYGKQGFRVMIRPTPEALPEFAILESDKPSPKAIDYAEDFSELDMETSDSESLELARSGHFRAGLITAWAGFEAALRHRLRAAGERADWGVVAEGHHE